MLNKKNKILTALFVILLIIATEPYWGKRLGLEERFGKQTNTTVVKNAQQISQITISRSEDNKLILKKENDQWFVNDHLADPTNINNLLSDLNNLSIDSTVSTNPENYTDYTVDDDNAVTVELVDSGSTQTILVGDPGPRPNSFFARIKDQNDTYLVQGELQRFIQFTEPDWRDKTIANFSPADLTQIEIINNNVPITVTKNEQDQWEAVSSNKSAILGENTATTLLENLNPLTANGFATDDEKTIFNRSRKNIIRISNQSGEISEITVVDNDKNWLVQASGQEEIFTASASTINTILLDPSTIFTN